MRSISTGCLPSTVLPVKVWSYIASWVIRVLLVHVPFTSLLIPRFTKILHYFSHLRDSISDSILGIINLRSFINGEEVVIPQLAACLIDTCRAATCGIGVPFLHINQVFTPFPPPPIRLLKFPKAGTIIRQVKSFIFYSLPSLTLYPFNTP